MLNVNTNILNKPRKSCADVLPFKFNNNNNLPENIQEKFKDKKFLSVFQDEKNKFISQEKLGYSLNNFEKINEDEKSYIENNNYYNHTNTNENNNNNEKNFFDNNSLNNEIKNDNYDDNNNIKTTKNNKKK